MCTSVRGLSLKLHLNRKRSPAATALAQIGRLCRCLSLAENNPSNISLYSLGVPIARISAVFSLEDSPAMLAFCHTCEEDNTWTYAFLLLRHCLKKKIPSFSSAHNQMCRILRFFEFMSLHTRKKYGAFRLTEIPIR